MLKATPVPFRGPGPPQTALCILGGPYVIRHGRRISVPEGGKRLLVFVALHGGQATRRYAAGSLWPDGGDARACGNLRSALWRLKRAGIDLLTADKFTVGLRPETEVDVLALHEWAARVSRGVLQPSDLDMYPTCAEAVDILPGWYDEWVIFERERLRQRMLHALEALSRDLIERRMWCEAVEAAMTAVSIEPLRESAQVALAQAHLAEGNVVEARRSIARYRSLLRTEMGIDLTGELATVLPGAIQRGFAGSR